MNQHKVFSSGFSNDAWVGSVFPYIFTDVFPNLIKNSRRTCKMYACKIAVAETNFTEFRTICINKVNNAIGQAGLLQNLHKQMCAENLGVGRFPDNNISTQCCGSW